MIYELAIERNIADASPERSSSRFLRAQRGEAAGLIPGGSLYF